MTGPTHDYVGKPIDGVIYVIVAEREKFDADECGGACAVAGGQPKRNQESPFAVNGALTETVTTALTIAAAATLRANPEIALRVALAALSVSAWSTPAKLAGTSFVPGVGSKAERDFDAELHRLLGTTTTAVIEDLAVVVADTLNLRAHHHDSRDGGGKALVAALPATAFLAAAREAFLAEDYFKRATKKTAIAALEEMHDQGHHFGLMGRADLDRMKKADLATWAAEQARACGWLPPELRHPEYAIIVAAKSEAA